MSFKKIFPFIVLLPLVLTSCSENSKQLKFTVPTKIVYVDGLSKTTLSMSYIDQYRSLLKSIDIRVEENGVEKEAFRYDLKYTNNNITSLDKTAKGKTVTYDYAYSSDDGVIAKRLGTDTLSVFHLNYLDGMTIWEDYERQTAFLYEYWGDKVDNVTQKSSALTQDILSKRQFRYESVLRRGIFSDVQTSKWFIMTELGYGNIISQLKGCSATEEFGDYNNPSNSYSRSFVNTYDNAGHLTKINVVENPIPNNSIAHFMEITYSTIDY